MSATPEREIPKSAAIGLAIGVTIFVAGSWLVAPAGFLDSLLPVLLIASLSGFAIVAWRLRRRSMTLKSDGPRSPTEDLPVVAYEDEVGERLTLTFAADGRLTKVVLGYWGLLEEKLVVWEETGPIASYRLGALVDDADRRGGAHPQARFQPTSPTPIIPREIESALRRLRVPEPHLANVLQRLIP